MNTNKELKNFGMPWEEEFAYSQAVKVGDTIYLSGQISHDENGDTVGISDMETQMRQRYAPYRQEIFPGAGMALTAVKGEKLAFPELLIEISASPRCDCF